MDKYRNYGELLLQYPGQWIALTNDESAVVAYGPDLAGVVKETQLRRDKDVIFVKVARDVSNFSYS